MTLTAMILLFLGNLRPSELLLIALIILLLFGGRKIPELMRGIGKGIRSFRQGMNEVSNEINADSTNKPDEPKA